MWATYNRKRLALFVRSYSAYFFRNYFDSLQSNKEKNRQTSRLAKILSLDTKLLKISLKHPSFEGESNTTKIYLQIEKEMRFLVAHREDGFSFVEEDYGHALLEPAIERVSGNALSKVGDNGFAARHEQLKRKYTDIYYTVARKYKLPTVRVLPFILRLITPPTVNT